MKKNISLFLFLLQLNIAVAQKVETLCGEADYTYPSYVSKVEAENEVAKRARVEALAMRYGTTIGVDAFTVSKNKVRNEEVISESSIEAFGYSQVKGEWLGDTREPLFEYFTDNKTGQQTIRAKVCFKAREIISAHTQIEYHLLKNGKTIRYESTSFRDGDEVYLTFRTPRNGYVAVYLYDHEQSCYCMVPETSNPEGQQAVKHDQDYLFLDGLVLTADAEVEYNTIYIIFSPNPFTKVNGQHVDGLVVTDKSLFNKWMSQVLTKDKEMQVEKIEVEIRR